MMKLFVALILSLCHFGRAFRPLSIRHSRSDLATEIQAVNRRDLMDASLASVAALGLNLVITERADASGGATAGGAYLLSAKQRYNTRVSKGVANFGQLKVPLETGDIAPVRAFFTNEDEGSWKDFSSAGYLLANAFRRNSSAAPDTLPSVQKWKAFAARVEAMTAALKKKDTSSALVAYQAAAVALDEYLEKVELPAGK